MWVEALPVALDAVLLGRFHWPAIRTLRRSGIARAPAAVQCIPARSSRSWTR